MTAHRKRVAVQVRIFNNWLQSHNSTLVYNPLNKMPKRRQMITPLVNCVFKIRKVQLDKIIKYAEEDQITMSRYMRNVTDKWIKFKEKKKCG